MTIQVEKRSDANGADKVEVLKGGVEQIGKVNREVMGRKRWR